ncbi:MAG: trigger factor family protein, partial [Erysipelotrichaceae bacterium]|nr:trigger factor family protein [Erysipelotrichaceae bacterium]
MSNWTLKEKSQGELQVTIEGEVWLDAQKKAFDKLAKNVEIKGFRKGQAPEKLVRGSINPQQI